MLLITSGIISERTHRIETNYKGSGLVISLTKSGVDSDPTPIISKSTPEGRSARREFVPISVY